MNLVFAESEGGHWRLHVASVSADEGSDLVHPHLPFSSRGVWGARRMRPRAPSGLETKTPSTFPSSPTHLLTMERLPIKSQEWKGFLWFLAPCPLGRREGSPMYLAIARHVEPTLSWSQAHLPHFTWWFWSHLNLSWKNTGSEANKYLNRHPSLHAHAHTPAHVVWICLPLLYPFPVHCVSFISLRTATIYLSGE